MRTLEEKAEKKRLSNHVNKPLGFCPLINGECKINCVNYCKSSISTNRYIDNNNKVERVEYTLSHEYCSSPLITG